MSSNSSVLFVFILAQLDREPQSAYDLNRRSGISLGASLPALARLQTEGLVTKTTNSKATNRPRFEFQLTPSGRKLARAGWKTHIAVEPPSDIDAVLRIADLALQYGSDRRQVTEFLKRAATSRELLARQAELDASRAEADKTNRSISYRLLRDRCDAARLWAEAKVLRAAVRNTPSRER